MAFVKEKKHTHTQSDSITLFIKTKKFDIPNKHMEGLDAFNSGYL